MSDFSISKNAKNRIVLGIEDVDRRLAALGTREAGKVARAGVSAGLTELAGEERTQALADTTFPQSQRSKARGNRSAGKALAATVGKKFKVGKAGQDVTAKAGFAVGRRSKNPNRKGKSGVGISHRNEHWLVLGTQMRFTKSGRSRGRIVGPVPAIRKAWAAAHARVAEKAEAAARSKLEEVTAALARS